ncbi:hypothetical protein HD554DRAFT_2088881 [Boletus coccyginus]|nr:hypothetical protein HD554DRAFT_2088881 [Boletus coccyginus]
MWTYIASGKRLPCMYVCSIFASVVCLPFILSTSACSNAHSPCSAMECLANTLGWTHRVLRYVSVIIGIQPLVYTKSRLCNFFSSLDSPGD